MNELTTFSNAEFGSIRTVQINDEPWFAGKDVALALGYNNPQKAIRDHVDEDDRGVNESFTPGGIQNLTIINESGLYSLILSSKLPDAKRFKRWVTGEVLPALRKTGRYETPMAAQRLLTPDDYLKAASIVAACKTERLPYVLLLIGKAGIDTSLLPEKAQRQPKPKIVERDTTTAKLINRVCSEYGVSLRAIERASGVWGTQLTRIRRGESFPAPERAAIIRDAIHRLVPELNEETIA